MVQSSVQGPDTKGSALGLRTGAQELGVSWVDRAGTEAQCWGSCQATLAHPHLVVLVTTTAAAV